MTAFFVCLIIVWAYALMCWWVTYWSGPFRLRYVPWIAWLLRRTNRMRCITLGASCYVDDPVLLREMPTRARVHEHVHYIQWQRRPLTFLPVYLYRAVRYGYDKHPDEQQARRESGEGER